MILLIIVVVLAVQNANREKSHMAENLLIKGAALIMGVEAGARTGMMGMMWGGAQVQRLLEETAKLPEVLYMAVVDKNGTVLAHSNPERIGEPFRPNDRVVHIGPEHQENWEMVTLPEGRRAFEVHRYFRPLRPGWMEHGRQMGAMMGNRRHPGFSRDDWFDPRQSNEQIIIVGLDISPFEQAIAGDIRQMVVLSAVLLLLGFAGFVSLFWMHNYQAARRSLQDTSAFADEIVTHLPVGVIATDRQGRIAFFNSSAEKIIGVPMEKAIGRLPDELLPEQLGGLQEMLDNGHIISEKEMECKFGGQQIVPLSISATRIINEEGVLVGRVLILRDLGEVRRLQAEIQRQEKLVALGGLAAGVAHEIRNPLSSIKGLATYFGGKFAEGSEDREVAGVMIREVDRLNRVISELLEFARPTDIQSRLTDINELLRRSLQLVQQDAAAKQIVIEPHLSEDLCPVGVDPDRVSQCLLNLYLNAIQAMPQGGRLEVASALQNNRLSITVSDTGNGIEPENLEKIFNPYFTTKPKGTGLGLAIVHKIIEAHGGRIHVDSVPGKGTRFRMLLPCSEGAQFPVADSCGLDREEDT